MRRASVLVLLLAFPLLAPPAHATDSWAPSTVTAVAASLPGGGAAVVSWTPGATLADAYAVYGVTGSTVTLLTTSTSTSATVPLGYAHYAVSGILDGTESDKTEAWPVCPYIDLEHLYVALTDC